MTQDAGSLLARSRRLAPFRDRLLRRVVPASRQATLDLACGHGSVTAELVERVAGPVVAVDADATTLRDVTPAAARVRADAHALPFRDGAFELVVTQAAWLWFRDPLVVAREARRVLAPGGVLVSVGECDFGGALEHPATLATARDWEAVLRARGADPHVGRRLPGVLRRAGFSRVEAELFGPLAAPAEVVAWREEDVAHLAALGASEEVLARARAAVVAAREAPEEALVSVPTLGLVAWR